MIKRFLCTVAALSLAASLTGCGGAGLDSSVSDASASNSAAGPAPAAKVVYVANRSANSIQALPIDASGQVGAALGGGSIPAGSKPGSVVTTPDHNFVYVGNSNAGITGFSVGADGALTPLAGFPVTTAADVQALTVSADGQYLFSANQNNRRAFSGAGSVSVYSIGANGGLTAVGAPTGVTGRPVSLVASADGHSLYVGLEQGQIYAFSINNATLQQLGCLDTSQDLTGLALNPNGQFLYATLVSENGKSQVMVYSVLGSGGLAQATAVPAGGETNGLAFSPNGNFAYSPNTADNTVTVFAVNAKDGTLSQVATVPAPGSPQVATVSEDGQTLNLLGATTLTTFHIGADGTLSAAGAALTVSAAKTTASPSAN